MRRVGPELKNKWRARNPEKGAAYQKAYYAKNRERILARCAAWRARNQSYIKQRDAAKYAANPEKHRERDLHQRYRMTAAEYAALLAAQGGGCACCGSSRSGRKTTPYLCVDHDHKTGKVRGLLCHRCNVVLGYSDEDPARLRTLADYIEAHASAREAA